MPETDNPTTTTGGVDTPILTSTVEPKKQSGALIDRLKGKGFKPGISGNPLGRYVHNTKTLSISKELRHQLNQKPRGSKKTYCELLVTNTLKKAIQGDARLIKEIFDRVDGLPTQKIHFEAEIKVNELAEALKALCNNAPLPAVFDSQIEEANVEMEGTEKEKTMPEKEECLTRTGGVPGVD